MSSELREDQEQVVERFLGWLEEVRQQPCKERWAHIVLPPRTGKTVIAAHSPGARGCTPRSSSPPRVLVHQTRRELRRHAPAIEVGAHSARSSAPSRTGST